MAAAEADAWMRSSLLLRGIGLRGGSQCLEERWVGGKLGGVLCCVWRMMGGGIERGLGVIGRRSWIRIIKIENAGSESWYASRS